MNVPRSDNLHASADPDATGIPARELATAPEVALARVPKAPRVPSRAAEALLDAQDATDKRVIFYSSVWIALQLLGVVGTLRGGEGGPPPVTLVVNAVFILIGALFLTVARGELRARRPTFTSGIATVGKVTELRPGKEGKATLYWTFKDGVGAAFMGVLTAKRSLLGEHFAGADIVVLYDPANPKQNIAWLD